MEKVIKGLPIRCWSSRGLFVGFVALALALALFLGATQSINATIAFAGTPTSGSSADTGVDENKVVTVMCNVINVIQGGVGKTIAVLILISMAIGLFIGKISWGLAIAAGVGMGLLFGAPALVDVISGEGAKIADTCKNLKGGGSGGGSTTP